jgi:hypothetical protein
MRRAALLGALVVLALGALLVVRPFVAAQRDYPASVPSPASLRETSTVPLKPRDPVCFERAVIERHSEEVRFNVASPSGPAPAIRVRLRGDGYRYDGELPAGALDTQHVRVAIPAAPRDLEVRVCFENLGDEAIGLYASRDRTRSRSLAVVDGEETDASIWFAFYENHPHTLLERLPATVERITVFRPGYVTTAVVWALVALFVVGAPAGAVWAYLRGLREDERAAPRELDVRRRRTWWQRLVG